MEREWLAEEFESNRPRLRSAAYGMLGSTSEAEDAVQEEWLRLSRAEAAEIQNLGGWLTTVVGECAWTCCGRDARDARSRWSHRRRSGEEWT